MANLYTDFRAALAADLASAFPTAEVHQGPRVGKAVDKPRICVFWPGSNEESGAVVVGESRFIIRYWPVSAKVADQSPAGVRDPGELEQAAWDLQALLETKQQAYAASGAWFSRLVSVEPDYDPEEWGVQAVILVKHDNPATWAF